MKGMFVVAYAFGALAVWLAMAQWGRRLDEQRLIERAVALMDFAPLIAAMAKLREAMNAWGVSVARVSLAFAQLGEALARDSSKMSAVGGGKKESGS